MKKINLISIATISILAMALNACNKDISLQEIEQESAGTIMVSVDGLMGEYLQGNDTKSGLISTTRVKWSTADKVYVYDGSSYLGELTVSLKDGKDYYAVLTGDNITAPQSGTTKLTLVHSNAFTSNPEINDGKVSLDLSSQEGSTKPDDIPFVAYATLDYTSGTPEISGQIAGFSLATSLMRLNCTGLKASAAITGAKLTGMSNECALNITKDGVTVSQGNMGDINVSFTGISASAKGAQTLYAALARNGTAADQTLEVIQTRTRAYSFGSKTRDAGKAFNAICQLVSVIPVGALPGEFTVDASGKKVYFSKGNLQATYNSNIENYSWAFAENQYDYVGNNAGNTTIDDHGAMEMHQQDGSKVDLFGWTAKQMYQEGSPKYYGINISTTPGDYGLPGESEVDWGSAIDDNGTWRILSKEEWGYLFNIRTVNGGTKIGRTYSTGIIYGGKNGLVIYPDDYTGDRISGTITELPEGVVFLPAAGFRRGSNVFADGEYGYYWSSTEKGYDSAWYMYFTNASAEYQIFKERSDGQSVRLVTDVTE